MSGNYMYHVNVRFYGIVAYGKKDVNDPPYFGTFVITPPPSEKELALQLNQLGFPSCKNGLYQV
jgi:hypothetical protein